MDPIATLKRSATEAIGKHELPRALVLLNEALDLAPDDRALWSNRAYVHELRKAPADALSDARRAIELDPGFSKAHLRLGRALIALGRTEEAYSALASAVERWPQDYALAEALSAAGAASRGGDSGGGGGSAVAASEAALLEAAQQADARAMRSTSDGLASSYYYAAVPAARHTLPVRPPERIEASADAERAKELAASGAVRVDIERRGGDSYYYAHGRVTDYHVPSVPHRIAADGSLSPWDPSQR